MSRDARVSCFFYKVDNSIDPATGQPRREVWGIATEEQPDRDKEILDYLTSEPYFKAWSHDIEKRTDGQSLGNVREMHQLVAAGKLISIEFDDTAKQIRIGAKIVDDQAWNKCWERVYTGFSIGGKYIKTWTDPHNSGLTRYTANPMEISVVDLPCLPTATFDAVKTVELVKADGSRSSVPLNPKPTVRKSDAPTARVAGEDLPASAFLIVPDPDKPSSWKLPWKFESEEKTTAHLRNALARFDSMKGISQSDKDAAWKKLVRLCRQYKIDVTDEKKTIEAMLVKSLEEHKIVYKGMYEVANLAQLVQQMFWLRVAIEDEQFFEGDEDSALPVMMQEEVDRMIDLLVAAVHEEATELAASNAAGRSSSNTSSQGGPIMAAQTVADLTKAANAMVDHCKVSAPHHSDIHKRYAENAAAHQAQAEGHQALADEHTNASEAHSDLAECAGKAADGSEMQKSAKLHKALARIHQKVAAVHTKMAGNSEKCAGVCTKAAELHKNRAEHFGTLGKAFSTEGKEAVVEPGVTKTVTADPAPAAAAAAAAVTAAAATIVDPPAPTTEDVISKTVTEGVNNLVLKMFTKALGDIESDPTTATAFKNIAMQKLTAVAASQPESTGIRAVVRPGQPDNTANEIPSSPNELGKSAWAGSGVN